MLPDLAPFRQAVSISKMLWSIHWNLTFTTLWANSAEKKLIDALGGNLNEMSNPILFEKKKQNKKNKKKKKTNKTYTDV